MARPVSPVSIKSSTPSTTPGQASSRICRSLVVDSQSFEGGLRSTLYCRVSIPLSTKTSTHPLLTLNPLTTLLSHSNYSLPLRFTLSSSSSDALAAASKLNIPLLEGGPESTVGYADGRKGNGVYPPLVGGSGVPEAVVIQDEEGQISLEVEPVPQDGLEVGRKRSNSLVVGGEEGKRAEWIVVLRLETGFGEIQLPRFANTIDIPLPMCLRNTITLSLPQSEWDLAFKPPIRPTNSSSSLPSTPDRSIISGTFLSSSELSVVWAPRTLENEPEGKLLLEKARMNIKWKIGEEGRAVVDIDLNAKVDRYGGLKETAWIELYVAGAGEGDWEVVSVEGDVSAWDVLTRPNPTNAIRRSRASSQISHPRLAPERVEREGEQTPIPRRKTRRSLTIGPRPPSFTSLFDTPEPIPPKLDPLVIERLTKVPSLMGVKAPFEDGEQGEMSFELGASVDTPPPDTPVESVRSIARTRDRADSTIAKTPLRIQVPIRKILTRTSTLKFTLSISLSFPRLSTAINDPRPNRYALPTFTVPCAREEEVVVSVSAGAGGNVELVEGSTLLDGKGGDQSPLPSKNGNARWQSLRRSSSNEEAKRVREASEETVLVDVTLPASRPDSMILFPSMEEATPLAKRGRKTSTLSLMSRFTAEDDGGHPEGMSPIRAPSIITSSKRDRSITINTGTISRITIKLISIPPSSSSATKSGSKEWTIFARMNFNHPFSGSIDFPHSEGIQMEVLCGWNEFGIEERLETSRVEDETTRVEDGQGLKEVHYKMMVQDGRGFEVVLPRFEVKVAELHVEVLQIGRAHV